MPMWNYTESTVAQKPVKRLVKCMPKYTKFIYYILEKGKAVSIHAMSTNRTLRYSSIHS